MWNEVGDLWIRVLVDQGLPPEHYLLNVNCGSLRSVQYLGYLDEGHHYGVDPAIQHIDDRNHPRDQRMLRFRKQD